MKEAARPDTNMVNLSDASQLLEVSYVTLWRWIKCGKVTPARVLGMPFLTYDQIEYLKNMKNKKNN